MSGIIVFVIVLLVILGSAKKEKNKKPQQPNTYQKAAARPKNVQQNITQRNNAQRNNVQRNREQKNVQPDIVKKAQMNSQRYAQKDRTLDELEQEHRHSERVMNPEVETEDENLLGSVEDLMVKGYDGNLSFERDFIGEATDFLNNLGV